MENRVLMDSPCLRYVKEVRKVNSMEEVTSLLLTGEWIAVLATSSDDGFSYVMGRVN